MRRPCAVRLPSVTSVAFLLSLAFPCAAFAAWSTEPVTVTPTTASIPMVEACSDGGHGSFVIWQEESSPGMGVLRAQHLLPTGDLDPTWPAEGALVCGELAARSLAAALPDRLGGFYLWWKEGLELYLTRFDGTGHVAASWPTRGRDLGSVWGDSPEPCVIEDGAHGVYAAMVSTISKIVTAYHLGPDNSGAGGWPNSPRGIGPTGDGIADAYYPQLALAPDGGVFVGWGFFSRDTTVYPSEFKLRRLTSAGLNVTGWPMEGLGFGTFRRELLGTTARSAILALSPDDRGGVFLMAGYATSDGMNPAFVTPRLYRVQGDGQPAGDWPSEGRGFPSLGLTIYFDAGPGASYRVLTDGRDGAMAGGPQYFSDGPIVLELSQFLPTVAEGYGDGIGGDVNGIEIAKKPDTGIYLATFHPDGPYSAWDANAFLHLGQAPAPPGWTDFVEYHPEPVLAWYGDIGLAATEDGGSVFFWSQVRERIGLFARGFNALGEITAVAPTPSPLGLHGLRFVRGAGVRGSVSLPDEGPARLALYDVSGRRVASQDVGGAPGTREVTFGGTQALTPGLYFARLATPRGATNARVVVTH